MTTVEFVTNPVTDENVIYPSEGEVFKILQLILEEKSKLFKKGNTEEKLLIQKEKSIDVHPSLGISLSWIDNVFSPISARCVLGKNLYIAYSSGAIRRQKIMLNSLF